MYNINIEMFFNLVFIGLFIVGIIYFGAKAYQRKGREGFEEKNN